MSGESPDKGRASSLLSVNLENSDSALKLAICALLIVACIIALIGWAFTSKDLRIPLLVVGLSVVALGLVLNKGAAAVTLAILIVGVLVAPRDYLLRIAHMISRPEAPFETYAKKYEGEGAPPVQTAVDDIVGRVLQTLEARGLAVPAKLEKEIGRVVSDEAVQALARRVMLEDAIFPLRQVVADKSQTLAEDFGSIPYFVDDMNFLKSEGLVSFSGTRYSEAVPTEVGQRVSATFESRFVTESSAFDLDTPNPFDTDRPEPEDISVLNVSDEPTSATFPEGGSVSWYRFSPDSSEKYIIDVTSPAGDPVVRLYGPDGFILLEEDDDSGEGWDARIERELHAGEYYIGIKNLNGQSELFEIKISQARDEDERVEAPPDREVQPTQ